MEEFNVFHTNKKILYHETKNIMPHFNVSAILVSKTQIELKSQFQKPCPRVTLKN